MGEGQETEGCFYQRPKKAQTFRDGPCQDPSRTEGSLGEVAQAAEERLSRR